MWFSLSLFVCSLLCSLFSSGAEARNAAAFPGASAPFVLGGCKAGPAGGRAFCGSPRAPAAPLTLRATSHPAALLTLPKLASGLSGAAQPAGHPASRPAIGVAFLFIGLAGLPEPRTLAGNPAPRPAMSAAFFFIGPATPLAPLTFRATSRPPPPRTMFFLYCPWRCSPCNLLTGLARRPAFVSFSRVAFPALPVWR